MARKTKLYPCGTAIPQGCKMQDYTPHFYKIYYKTFGKKCQ